MHNLKRLTTYPLCFLLRKTTNKTDKEGQTAERGNLRFRERNVMLVERSREILWITMNSRWFKIVSFRRKRDKNRQRNKSMKNH